MDEELKEELGIMSDSIESALFMVDGPTSKMISCDIHLVGCVSMLKQIKEKLDEMLGED